LAAPHHGGNTSAHAATLAVKSSNNKIIYQNILTALADATNDPSMPGHEQQTAAASDYLIEYLI